jgi:hypothetical protein
MGKTWLNRPLRGKADLHENRSECPEAALPYRQAIPATLSSNKLFVSLLLQHRFHFIQAIDSGAHLRLINDARSVSIHGAAAKIHLHLALFLGDDGLNDRRGLLWSGVGLA